MLKFSLVPKASCNFPQNLEVNLRSRYKIMDIGIACYNAPKIPYNFFYDFIIYSEYKLSQRGYFLGIVK